MKQYIAIALCALLPACQSTQKSTVTETFPEPIVDLMSSTRIIRTLIKQEKLAELLDCTPEDLEILLDNVSPAQLALQLEVISIEDHLVAVYYYKDSPEERTFINNLALLATDLEKIKFVVIEGDKLNSLTQVGDVETFPTLLIVDNGTIIDRLEQGVTLDTIREKLTAAGNLKKGSHK